MGNTEHLFDRKAIMKFQELIDHNSLCMMVSDPANYPGNSRPMSVVEVDDNGAFWFLTLRTSEKFDDLAKDPRVSLYFADPSSQEYLAVHGRTEVLNDMERKKELWRPIASAWVAGGVEDPDLRVLKVIPQTGYYWDTKDGKVLAGLKIAFSMITGKTNDDGGVEGKLKV